MTPSDMAAPLRRLSRSSRSPRWTCAPASTNDLAPASERDRPITLWPAPISSGMSAIPMKPVAPVTNTRMTISPFLISANRVERSDHFGRKMQRCRFEILAKMPDGRRTRDQQNVRRALKQPRQRDLHRRGPESVGDGRQLGRLQRREPAERKERHVRDTLAGQIVDQGVVIAESHV